MYDNKRPGLFLDLAECFPQADFIWYGEGELRQSLLEEVTRREIGNAFYPGPVSNVQLADRFREAHLFVLPSLAEGVPKVTQEAAACGLPVVVFGFYEAPTVIDGKNGYVVWDDAQLFSRVEELIGSSERRAEMGAYSADIAAGWGWDTIVPCWEKCILDVAGK